MRSIDLFPKVASIDTKLIIHPSLCTLQTPTLDIMRFVQIIFAQITKTDQTISVHWLPGYHNHECQRQNFKHRLPRIHITSHAFDINNVICI